MKISICDNDKQEEEMFRGHLFGQISGIFMREIYDQLSTRNDYRA